MGEHLTDEERESLADVLLASWRAQGSLHPPFDTDRDDALQDADAILSSDWLAAHVARATADAEARGRTDALDAVIVRADEGNEFGPQNYLLLVRIVTAVRAALDPAPTTDADGRDERRDGAGGAS